MREFAGKHILIVIENLPAPFDRRVWQEAKSLKSAGAEVSIICPKMRGYTKKRETLDGINIYRHPLREGSGAMGYLIEYVSALFWEFFLAWKIFLQKRFHVIHGCNPPDLIFILSLPFKLFGVKYVFDHHDINPELYLAKFNKRGVFYHLMMLFERMTFLAADFSIATNESYKEIAINRGKMKSEKIRVIRSGPSLSRLKLQSPNEKYKRGKKYLIGYLGVIGEQEGIDLLLQSICHLRETRDDFVVSIVGGGTAISSLEKLSQELLIDDIVEFHGRVSDDVLLDVLNTADVCVNPDKPTDMNNLSTMNKIMEYMALEKPIVQYDLKEGRFSAQEASLYAKDVEDFAVKINQLLESPEQRDRMGSFGRNRVINELAWEYEEVKLINFYREIL